MRAFLFLFLLLSTTALLAQSADYQFIKKSLRNWSPKEFIVQGSNVTVVLNERKVTTAIYQAVIGAGICPTELIQEGALANIGKIHVVNMFRHSGFTYTGGQTACKKLNRAGVNEWDVAISMQTEVYQHPKWIHKR